MYDNITLVLGEIVNSPIFWISLCGAILLSPLIIHIIIKEQKLVDSFESGRKIYYQISDEYIEISKDLGWSFSDDFFTKNGKSYKIENLDKWHLVLK